MTVEGEMADARVEHATRRAQPHALQPPPVNTAAPSPSPRDVQEAHPSLRPIELSALAEAREQNFRTLYETQVTFVWRNLRRLGVPEADADDRTQEVFVVAYRRFRDFEERGHGPRAWLFQIALRVASGARRHRRRHPETPDGGAAVERETIDALQTEVVERREKLSQLDSALATVPLGRRAVLVLHEIEEMSAPEISEILGAPLNTVYSRLRVARGELEQALTERRGDDDV